VIFFDTKKALCKYWDVEVWKIEENLATGKMHITKVVDGRNFTTVYYIYYELLEFIIATSVFSDVVIIQGNALNRCYLSHLGFFCTHFTNTVFFFFSNQGPTSRYCGVSFRKSERKWLAQIAHRGSKLNIGAFEVEEDAARAWDAKAMQLRGELTPVNFPIFPDQPRIQKNPKHGKAARGLKRNAVPEDKGSKFFTDMGFQRFTLFQEYLVYSACYKQPAFSSYCKFIAEAQFTKEIDKA